METLQVCPQCSSTLDEASHRLVQDACGHRKCRLCLLSDELNCKLCENTSKVVGEEKENPPPDCIKINENGSFFCTNTNRTFKTKAQVKYHKYCDKTVKKPFTCAVCDKEFISKTHYETHLLVHKNWKPFRCNICGKCFMENSKLKRHNLIHQDVKHFICQECGKGFKSKENLRTHSRIHQPDKPYKCGKCEKSFSHSSNLRKHVQQLHQSEKRHMCDVCGKQFKLNSSLNLHKKNHTQIRKNSCKYCKKSFTHLKDLQRHELIHTGTKLFQCGLCDTSFKRKDNLQRHTKTNHPDKKPVIMKQTVSVVVPNPNAKPQPSKCETNNAVPVINAPLKLAFKTSAFKSCYNIKRDYVEDDDSTNVYEKILLPSQPVSESTKHNLIKNIKFKLPADYLKQKEDTTETKTYTELQPVKGGVIVNHWRRRAADNYKDLI